MSENRFKCPKCGSDNIQSYEMVYRSGMSKNSSVTDGISIGSDFNVAKSVSHLAETCAPPVMKEKSGCGCLLAIIFLSLAALLLHPVAAALVFIGLVV